MQRHTVWRLPGGRGSLLVAGAVLAGLSCATLPPRTTQTAQAAEPVGQTCWVAPPTRPATSLWIAVTSALVPADAPSPRTDAERIVFPLLYQVPLHIGCAGGPRAATDSAARPAAGDSLAADDAPALARPLPGPEVIWPGDREASASYVVRSAVDTALDMASITPGALPRLHVSRVTATAGRDALDAGADAVITSDATTIAYAATRPELEVVALPWSHTYVLLQSGRVGDAPSNAGLALRTGLASDAVPVDARPADDAVSRAAMTVCDTAPAAVAASAATPLASRIVYPRGDDVARALSARLVALVNTHDSIVAGVAPALVAAAPVRAEALDSAQLHAALWERHDTAYVLELAAVGCGDATAVLAAAPWLRGAERSTAFTPLVDTRAHAILRRGRLGIFASRTGDVYLLFGWSPRI